jgi:hypothetical protein
MSATTTLYRVRPVGPGVLVAPVPQRPDRFEVAVGRTLGVEVAVVDLDRDPEGVGRVHMESHADVTKETDTPSLRSLAGLGGVGHPVFNPDVVGPEAGVEQILLR